MTDTLFKYDGFFFEGGLFKLFTMDVMAACLLGLWWQATSSRLGNRDKSGWAQIGITALLILRKTFPGPVNADLIAVVPVQALSMIHNVCREGRAIMQSASVVGSLGSHVINVLRGGNKNDIV